MRILVTGANGTIGSPLVEHLRALGHLVTIWDRRRTAIDDYNAMERFVLDTAPEVLFHLAIYAEDTGKPNESWLVNYEWPSELAWICRIHKIKFVCTSTAMVFSDSAKGPFTLTSVPEAQDGYGFEKRCAEERVFYQNPDAIVVRLGWQIGESPGSNNMVDFLEKQMAANGEVSASTRWFPACSFLEDTVTELASFVDKPGGLYMLDSNKQWSFFEICQALNELHNWRWHVSPSNEFVFDQRMQDDRLGVPTLDFRLSSLRN